MKTRIIFPKMISTHCAIKGDKILAIQKDNLGKAISFSIGIFIEICAICIFMRYKLNGNSYIIPVAK